MSPQHLRLCISTLGQFGRQADTNIALTAAESLLWGVSDSIQAKRRDEDKEPEYNALWMFLLLEVLGLCTDARPEVRVGAIQTLFRTLQLYGATLSLETWNECIWKVTFPLLDSITASIRRSSPVDAVAAEEGAVPAGAAPDLQWDESKILALQSIGSIFQDFLPSKIMRLESFTKAWGVFVDHIQDSWTNDNRSITAPALRCLEKAIKALSTAEDLKTRAMEALEIAWRACDVMGNLVADWDASFPAAKSPSPAVSVIKPFTQESLMPRLRAMAAEDPTQVVLVRGDRDVPYGKIMEVMGLVGQAGFTKVSLIAQSPGGALPSAPGAAAPASPANGAAR